MGNVLPKVLTAQINLLLPQDVAAEMLATARRSGLSMSAVVRMSVEESWSTVRARLHEIHGKPTRAQIGAAHDHYIG